MSLHGFSIEDALQEFCKKRPDPKPKGVSVCLLDGEKIHGTLPGEGREEEEKWK